MDKLIQFPDVPEEDKARFTSNCGVFRMHIKTRNNVFDASCRIHDWNYLRGGAEKDRLRADLGFYKRCLLNVSMLDNPFYIWYYSMAAFFWYTAVRLFGGLFFHYGPPRSVNEVLDDNWDIRPLM